MQIHQFVSTLFMVTALFQNRRLALHQWRRQARMPMAH
jgi:hypothetical protein